MFGEGNGARVVATVVICMGLLLLWPTIFGGSKKTKKDVVQTTTTDGGMADGGARADAKAVAPLVIDGGVLADGGVAPAVVVTPPPVPVSLDKPVQPALDASKEKTITIETPLVKATFSSFGGTLSHWLLKYDQYYTRERGERTAMDMVHSHGDPARFALALDFPESTARLPAVPIYDCKQSADYEVTCVYKPEAGTQGMVIQRVYRMEPDEYTLRMSLKVTNATSQVLAQVIEVKVPGYQDPDASSGGGMFSPPKGDSSFEAICHVDGKKKTRGWKKLSKTPVTEQRPLNGTVRFGGYSSKYFLFAAIPFGTSTMDNRGCAWRAVDSKRGAFEVGVRFAKQTLKPEEFVELGVGLYIGPKLLRRLERVQFEEDENHRLSSTVSLGWSWLAPIARVMLSVLRFFHGLVGNWGLSIILLTIVFKLLTLPLVQKQMRSMQNMKKLQPKMEALRAKYKDDKQRLNMEMMNLYKTNKINPLGGCLPMLLQMPIWFALYGTLNGAAELYQAPFAFWLDNLTAPDRYYVLPIILGGLMFLQQRITPQTMDSQQAKIMMWLMPGMFLVFSLFFPSGLSLYIMTNTLLGMAHQYWMNKSDEIKAPPKKPAPSAA